MKDFTKVEYRVRRLKPGDLNEKIFQFIFEGASWANDVYGKKFDFQRALILVVARDHYLGLCERDGVPVGFLGATLCRSIFDPNVRILRQDLLYAVPKTRASYYLLRDFIDFGKGTANHIITTIGDKTNIKPRSLERLGFHKLEELYRMECR